MGNWDGLWVEKKSGHDVVTVVVYNDSEYSRWPKPRCGQKSLKAEISHSEPGGQAKSAPNPHRQKGDVEKDIHDFDKS